MHITHETSGIGLVLLAFDGEVVGLVKEAFIGSKEDGGFILQGRVKDGIHDDRPFEERCTFTRREGRVDVLGVVGDPPEMLAARLFSIRNHLGLPTREDKDIESEGVTRAQILENLARRCRRGEVVMFNVNMEKVHESFPLPDGQRHVPTGEMSLEMRYADKALKASFEVQKAQWAKDHPELVAEYVRSKPDVPVGK